MGFYTTLKYYRPTPPPIVTGPRLADFLDRLHATGLFDRHDNDSGEVKFGRAIDQDRRDASTLEPAGLSGIYTSRSIKWDLEVRGPLADLAAALRGRDEPVYRADMSLGSVPLPVTEALQTPRPDDGEPNLCLWAVDLHVGPTQVYSLEAGRAFDVGWMAVRIGGDGYLWPWRPRDLTDRAAALAAIRPLTAACREAFPVDPDDPGPAFGGRRFLRRPPSRVDERRALGDLWPVDQLDGPYDWSWGVGEG